MKKSVALVLAVLMLFSTAAVALAMNTYFCKTCGNAAFYSHMRRDGTHYLTANPMHGTHRDTIYFYKQYEVVKCSSGHETLVRADDYQRRVCPY